MSTSIKYNEEQYNKGQDLMENIVSKINELNEEFTSYVIQAVKSEYEHAPIAYDGMYSGTLSSISNSINILSKKMETIESSIHQAREYIKKYNNGECSEEEVKKKLFETSNTYKEKYIEGFNIGEESIKLDYNNINEDGYTPQGITYVGNKILVSAYKDGKKSQIYVYDKDSGKAEYKIVLDNDAHVGGVTYDENNHVLLVTSNNGKVSAYDYESINTKANNIQGATYENSTEIDLNLSGNKNTVLNSNVNMNYNKLLTGNNSTDYNSATTYYDSDTNKIYIGRFAKEGKIVCGDVEYDKTTGTYNIKNEVTVNADSGIQGISTYHKDGNTYLVESRSYGENNTVITVRDITNGIENDAIVGSKVLDNNYGEGIFIDKSGQATVIHESGWYEDNNNTTTVDINTIIEENNKENVPIKIVTSEYETGDGTDKPGGYNPS